jgi:glycosyltransferase involved in cell wall biosynthesis
VDVIVHPSYREGLPRAVTQGLLGALPVVAYDVDGTKEVCIDGETGRLVPPGDHEALRTALLWMLAHPEERAAMGQRGRGLCCERFASAKMVADLEELYEALLRSS